MKIEYILAAGIYALRSDYEWRRSMADSLWSRVIWDILGKKDVKIHELSVEEANKYIDNWIRSVSIDEAKVLLNDLVGVVKKDVTYYDGPIHEIDGYTFYENGLIPLIMLFIIEFPDLIKSLPLFQEVAFKANNIISLSIVKVEKAWLNYCSKCKIAFSTITYDKCPDCGTCLDQIEGRFK